MSLYSVPSNSHGNLDEQIDQLMQCKPLSEQEEGFVGSGAGLLGICDFVRLLEFGHFLIDLEADSFVLSSGFLSNPARERNWKGKCPNLVLREG
ncbi:hypothetical protein SLEP1_g13136 [Rubroshorea leprosula]|uniref:Uncharacterized protein n=1 Tax=Rubroshorea leprosula TaxID=152421 RepID=A0AAV5IP93_9ROSI|nr:hypothetical protein SLEP1_g13136 [Rubroshorea leprosula]